MKHGKHKMPGGHMMSDKQMRNPNMPKKGKGKRGR